MFARRFCVAVFACFLIVGHPFSVAQAAQPAQPNGAATKLGRGLVNIITGWVEIPKRISETSAEQGAASGLTWGLLRGLGYGFVRTAAGFYEVLTFPVPQPPNYGPVIHPEYIFVDETTAATASRDDKYR